VVEAMEAAEEAMEEVEEAMEEVEDPPYASNMQKEIAPLVRIADLNTKVVVVVTEAMAVVAAMVVTKEDTEGAAEAMVEVVDMAVVVVVEYASTTRKVLAHMVPIADSNINRLFMKTISLLNDSIILTY